MSSNKRSICFITNNSISSQSILGNIINTLKHFPKYFSDIFLISCKKYLVLLSYQLVLFLSFHKPVFSKTSL